MAGPAQAPAQNFQDLKALRLYSPPGQFSSTFPASGSCCELGGASCVSLLHATRASEPTSPLDGPSFDFCAPRSQNTTTSRCQDLAGYYSLPTYCSRRDLSFASMFNSARPMPRSPVRSARPALPKRMARKSSPRASRAWNLARLLRGPSHDLRSASIASHSPLG